ncbi:hypothetical protein LguiA_000031 [Lonicera macranthoides]
MERVKNGVLRLPPGFRFHPTDEELVVQYLKRKVFSFPVPASIIPEVDVCKSDPWDLPGDSEKERYFFSTREIKYPNGNRSNRATGSGYWKATGLDKQILTCRTNQLVGMKKTLVFYRGKPPHGSRTNWIMHEYRLVTPPIPPTTHPLANNSIQNQPPCEVQLENWVICRIFFKKRSAKNEEETPKSQSGKLSRSPLVNDSKPVFYDFLAKAASTSSSSSGSSGITDASFNQSEDHDESSSCNSTLSTFRRKPCP